MNRIDEVFSRKKKGVLNIYFTAGYPKINDTLRIARTLEAAGVDIIEIGIPYSDPIADGPTIQDSSQKALDAGMSLKLLMRQLQDLRKHIKIPVILMGYINPVLQYGFTKFCQDCKEVGIDGVILPDLPMQEYAEMYQVTFEEYGIYNIFLMTPQTSEKRVLQINEASKGFIYMVSSASITGAKQEVSQAQIDYFERIQKMNLSVQRLIGFGISNKETFDNACQYASGAIIGSAFINQLNKDDSDEAITSFVGSIINP
ncbi:tryptophan synthase subunit alpha [Cyclobacteriaceae bacterium]|jgi:tryptophan synthase alpha chain|nr:tryptophan synthase subunit alpha [Cyclobacteriaceae bacterium]|tara:strand:+ start:7925 stop:8698 length:774 start_codon:yes stop_codon:yes gene_type:complete